MTQKTKISDLSKQEMRNRTQWKCRTRMTDPIYLRAKIRSFYIIYQYIYRLSVIIYNYNELKQLRDKRRFKGRPNSLLHECFKKYKPDRNLSKTVSETLKIQ